MTDTMTRAKQLADQEGWAVLPLAGKGPVRSCPTCRMDQHHGAACDCLQQWCHGFYGATADPVVIQAQWPRHADGIGIATGTSTLVVVDVDVDGPVGHEWVTRLAHQGVLTPTLMMRSSSGQGYHLYYSGQMQSRPLRVAPTHPAAGGPDDIPVDIKSTGSYVRWTGTVAAHRPIVPVPEGLGDVLDARQQRLDAIRIRAASSSRSSASAPVRPAGTGCVHSPGYLDRGVRMAVETIARIDPAGGGVHAQVYGAFRGIIRRHAETCGRDCVTGQQLDELSEAAGRVGERPKDIERAWDNALMESGIPNRFGAH